MTEIDDFLNHLEDDENFPLGQLDASDVSVSSAPTYEDTTEDTDIHKSKPTTSSSVPSIKSATLTRWYSTLAMLHSLGSKFNRKPVNTLFAKYNISEFKFDDQEWELIEDLTRFLMKFKQIVEMLCALVQIAR